MNKHVRQKGVALITVLMVLALATFAVVSIAYRLQLDIRRTENTLYHGQALQIAKLAEQLAKQTLTDDLNSDVKKKNKRDDLEEPWALVKDQKIAFEDIPVVAEIIDLQGRFNLNNLNQDEDAGKLARKQFKRLLNTLEINLPLQNTITDYIDTNQTPIPTPGGAEDTSYQSLDVAYLTANQNMKSPSELRLMLGISKEDYEKLLPFITTLNGVTQININTASPEVLTTIADNVSVSEVKSVLDSGRPFDSVADFTANKIFAGKPLDAKLLSVTSDYFLLKTTIFYGHIQQQQQVIFERQGTAVHSIMRAEGEI